MKQILYCLLCLPPLYVKISYSFWEGENGGMEGISDGTGAS
jgi:hypothetical protein